MRRVCGCLRTGSDVDRRKKRSCRSRTLHSLRILRGCMPEIRDKGCIILFSGYPVKSAKVFHKSPLSVLRTSFPRRGQEKTSTALPEAVLLGFPTAGGKHKGGLCGVITPVVIYRYCLSVLPFVKPPFGAKAPLALRGSTCPPLGARAFTTVLFFLPPLGEGCPTRRAAQRRSGRTERGPFETCSDFIYLITGAITR